MPTFGGYLLSSQNPRIGNGMEKRITKDLGFALKAANSSFTVHTVTCKIKKESLCQLAGIREFITTSSAAGEQEYKPKAALLRLLSKTPIPLTEMAQSYNSRGLGRCCTYLAEVDYARGESHSI